MFQGLKGLLGVDRSPPRDSRVTFLTFWPLELFHPNPALQYTQLKPEKASTLGSAEQKFHPFGFQARQPPSFSISAGCVKLLSSWGCCSGHPFFELRNNDKWHQRSRLQAPRPFLDLLTPSQRICETPAPKPSTLNPKP